MRFCPRLVAKSFYWSIARTGLLNLSMGREYKLDKYVGKDISTERTLEPTLWEWGLHQPIFPQYYELADRRHDLATE